MTLQRNLAISILDCEESWGEIVLYSDSCLKVDRINFVCPEQQLSLSFLKETKILKK